MQGLFDNFDANEVMKELLYASLPLSLPPKWHPCVTLSLLVFFLVHVALVAAISCLYPVGIIIWNTPEHSSGIPMFMTLNRRRHNNIPARTSPNVSWYAAIMRYLGTTEPQLRGHPNATPPRIGEDASLLQCPQNLEEGSRHNPGNLRRPYNAKSPRLGNNAPLLQFTHDLEGGSRHNPGKLTDLVMHNP